MTKALQGVRVLDLSRVLAGPYCTMILGDLGADIIKVERDGVGDDLRHWGPPFMPDGESTYFLSVNRNKRSVTLDLKSEAGRRLVLDLVAQCDVLVENFRLGVMESLGLGWDELQRINPRLVYCAITGFGRTGPLAEKPGYDVITQGMSGLMSVTGEQGGSPMRVGVAIVDLVTGLYASVAILGALQSRERTGRGQQVDVSLLESSLSIMPNLTAGFLMGGAVPQRFGNGHPNTVPYKCFPTQDGDLTLAVGNDGQWRRLCAAVGHPELGTDLRYAENQSRVARRDEVEALVCGWLAARGTDEWVRVLEAAEVPCGPIYGIERILQEPQVQALGLIKTLAHPTSGDVRVVGAPFHFGANDTEPHRPPPLLGEHTEAVLSEVLGTSPERLRELRAQGAFGRAPTPAAAAA